MEKDALPHEIAGLALRLGFLDETKYRDYCVREDYEIKKNEGMKNSEIIKFLCEKYSSSMENIRAIVYKK